MRHLLNCPCQTPVCHGEVFPSSFHPSPLYHPVGSESHSIPCHFGCTDPSSRANTLKMPPQPFMKGNLPELPPSFTLPSASEQGVPRICAYQTCPGSMSKVQISGSPRLPKFRFCREGHKMSSFSVVEAFFTSFQSHSPQGAQETTQGQPSVFWCVPCFQGLPIAFRI